MWKLVLLHFQIYTGEIECILHGFFAQVGLCISILGRFSPCMDQCKNNFKGIHSKKSINGIGNDKINFLPVNINESNRA